MFAIKNFLSNFLSLISYPWCLQLTWVSKNQNLNISVILSCAFLHVREMTKCNCSPIPTTVTLARNVYLGRSHKIWFFTLTFFSLLFPQWPGLMFTPKHHSELRFYFLSPVSFTPLGLYSSKSLINSLLLIKRKSAMLYCTFLGLLKGCFHYLVSQVHIIIFESKILDFKIHSVLQSINNELYVCSGNPPET